MRNARTRALHAVSRRLRLWSTDLPRWTASCRLWRGWPPHGAVDVPLAGLSVFSDKVVRAVPLHKLSQPHVDCRRRLVAEPRGCVLNVGIRLRHIARCHRRHRLVGGSADLTLKDFDEVAERLGAVVTQIEDLLGRAERQRRHDAVDDIVNVRKVSARAAVAVDLDWQPSRDPVRKREVRHVGPAPRAIDSEEAEAGHLRRAATPAVSRARRDGRRGSTRRDRGGARGTRSGTHSVCVAASGGACNGRTPRAVVCAPARRTSRGRRARSPRPPSSSPRTASSARPPGRPPKMGSWCWRRRRTTTKRTRAARRRGRGATRAVRRSTRRSRGRTPADVTARSARPPARPSTRHV
mmetsp:Transcript_36098/g.99717  ORF Transcript_36098/g.99717 Transcript_36098/m.99717 type:complete len:352 (-) Transcript_36098:436-1491(-)